MTTFKAGNERKLGIVRHGREFMELEEREADGQIFPGQPVERGMDGDTETFTVHSGDYPENELYVAVEARGRGMDAQTDVGYPDGHHTHARKASGGGFNVQLAAGETVTVGDPLVINGGEGNFVALDTAGGDAADDVVAYADEDLDLSGDDEDRLVGAEMET